MMKFFIAVMRSDDWTICDNLEKPASPANLASLGGDVAEVTVVTQSTF